MPGMNNAPDSSVGSQSIYQSAEFIELEKACQKACKFDADEAAKKLEDFDARRKERKRKKRATRKRLKKLIPEVENDAEGSDQ